MNVFGAIVAGLVGTAVFTMVMILAPGMGMPKMDIVGMLGTMFGKENRALGWMMHAMMGIIFGLIYAFLWSRGILSPTLVGGLIFGAGHWLIVGMIMGMIPMMHIGIRRGEVKAPGLWMTNNGGTMAFVGGLIGHLVFGMATAMAYSAI
ncbi:MAG: hypothetical protein L0287_14735 [Anaerolineae bacterium]|nr:hypothetical protein [Anaerolineae bacterium]MCI0609252.1 hypothetical protein [Anaerolineae bacterium]